MSRKNALTQLYRVLGIILADTILIAASFWFAVLLRSSDIFTGTGGTLATHWDIVLCCALCNVLMSILTRGYVTSWRYASGVDYMRHVAAVTVSVALTYLVVRRGNFVVFAFSDNADLTHMFYAMWLLLTLFFTTAMRICGGQLKHRYSRSTFTSSGKRKHVMIVGGGDTGLALIKSMITEKNTFRPVVVIDDDMSKHGLRLMNVPIGGGRNYIPECVERYDVEEIVIAIPSADEKNMREIMEICWQTGKKVHSVPSLFELLSGAKLSQLNEVDIKDLLGRKELLVDSQDIFDYIRDKTVLVTGGGGSIGSELCRQIAKFSPKRLIVFDIYENNVYELQYELLRDYPDMLNLIVLIGSVRDKERLDEVFDEYSPEVIFHAAAHKHVPLMEDSPNEAIKNNVYGTYNVASCAAKHGADRFVLISTDKAVNPTNIMGTSKRLAEIVVQQLAMASAKTIFAAVRFGNVLGSNGSVIPLFKQQIRQGGPVTVTHPEINRFFMTIPEAAQLVMQAGAYATGGEIFILDMGQPVKIVDLAKNLIKLSGYEPDVDIKIVYTGLRPGEKMYEELLLDRQKQTATKHDRIFVEPPVESCDALIREINALRKRLGCDCTMYSEMSDWLVNTFHLKDVQEAAK
ncbi:MAG: nucleoside-diphosphate sugar epimerase/dehydratase [Clostridia bacterium]|nr:nucleoside-diphosphate sugar epimerase/dehydratase [Clostridia bacterium]